jgi:hypothetical protein
MFCLNFFLTKRRAIPFKNIPYYNILILCAFVWPLIDSASGHHTDLSEVSLEPVGQGGDIW